MNPIWRRSLPGGAWHTGGEALVISFLVPLSAANFTTITSILCAESNLGVVLSRSHWWLEGICHVSLSEWRQWRSYSLIGNKHRPYQVRVVSQSLVVVEGIEQNLRFLETWIFDACLLGRCSTPGCPWLDLHGHDTVLVLVQSMSPPTLETTTLTVHD